VFVGISSTVRQCAGHGPFKGGTMATSGLVGMLMMVKLCNRVSVYGFGSVPKDTRLPSSGTRPRSLDHAHTPTLSSLLCRMTRRTERRRVCKSRGEGEHISKRSSALRCSPLCG